MLQLDRKEPWEWAILAVLALLGLIALAIAIWAVMRESWVIEAEHQLPHPPEAVFQAITDAEDRVAWQFGVTAVTTLRGTPGEPDWAGLIYMRADRKAWQMEERILDWRAPDSWSVSQDGPARTITIKARLKEEGDGAGTYLHWRETHHIHSWADRLSAPLSMPAREGRLDRSLDQLARHLDAR